MDPVFSIVAVSILGLIFTLVVSSGIIVAIVLVFTKARRAGTGGPDSGSSAGIFGGDSNGSYSAFGGGSFGGDSGGGGGD